MKIAVRSFAVAFVLTGFVLASHSQQNFPGSSNHRLAVSHQTVSVGMPPPACPPSDPEGCQMGPVPKAR